MEGTIRDGFGYWDCTDYPIGGCFRRAGSGGLLVRSIEKIPHFKGSDRIGLTDDGRRVAFGFIALETADQERLTAV
jgi:hypothetical protein